MLQTGRGTQLVLHRTIDNLPPKPSFGGTWQEACLAGLNQQEVSYSPVNPMSPVRGKIARLAGVPTLHIAVPALELALHIAAFLEKHCTLFLLISFEH